VISVTGKVGDYKGVSFTVGRSTPRDDEIGVATVVTRPGNVPNKVEWLVSTAGGSPKIVDGDRRGCQPAVDAARGLCRLSGAQHNNVQALIDAMRQTGGNSAG